MYLDANSLFRWTMSQKLHVNSFEWVRKSSKSDECFIKNYDESSDKEYFLEVDVKYSKKLFSVHSDLQFLPERKKIENVISLFMASITRKTMLFDKLVYGFHNKENYVVCIKALKKALNQGLILKKVLRVIQFNQNTWFKP